MLPTKDKDALTICMLLATIQVLLMVATTQLIASIPIQEIGTSIMIPGTFKSKSCFLSSILCETLILDSLRLRLAFTLRHVIRMEDGRTPFRVLVHRPYGGSSLNRLRRPCIDVTGRDIRNFRENWQSDNYTIA